MVMIQPINVEIVLKVRKIVINSKHGGFGVSPEAIHELFRRGCRGIQAMKVEDVFHDKGDESAFCLDEQIFRWRAYLSSAEALNPFQTYFSPDEKLVLACPMIDRDDPDLVSVVEQLGSRANAPLANLEIVEIPHDVVWQIQECDGNEHVAEAHRTWHGTGE